MSKMVQSQWVYGFIMWKNTNTRPKYTNKKGKIINWYRIRIPPQWCPRIHKFCLESRRIHVNPTSTIDRKIYKHQRKKFKYLLKRRPRYVKHR